MDGWKDEMDVQMDRQGNGHTDRWIDRQLVRQIKIVVWGEGGGGEEGEEGVKVLSLRGYHTL